MEGKQYAKEPLLYIHQPIIKKPTAQMQHDYYGTVQSPTDEAVVQQSNESNSDHSTTKNQKFNNMTLQQKVLYFLEKPEHVPEIQCLLRTDEKTLQGIITEFKNNEVYIKVGKRGFIEKIPFDQIITIQMVGF